MAGIFAYEHTVLDSEVGRLDSVECLTYLHWTRMAAMAHSSAQSWPEERYERCGIVWVARSDRIQYLQPAFAGDRIIVQTWVSSFRKTKSLRKYRIERPANDTLLVTAETEWTLIDLRERKPCRIPTALSDSFSLVPESGEPGS